jgi:hypothetical protein
MEIGYNSGRLMAQPYKKYTRIHGDNPFLLQALSDSSQPEILFECKSHKPEPFPAKITLMGIEDGYWIFRIEEVVYDSGSEQV